MRILLLFFFCFLASWSQAQVLSISEARNQALGATVTVRGMVSNGAELGKVRYLQDNGAGIAAYAGSGSASGFENAVAAGDSIEVSGVLLNYQGLLEINPVTAYQIISSGNPLPVPIDCTVGNLNETYEGRLVALHCMNFNTPGIALQGGGTYDVYDAIGQFAEIYLRSGHPLSGMTAPTGPTTLTGVLSQYNNTYQILPRYSTDFEIGNCLYFTQMPSQTEAFLDGIALEWETNLNTNCFIRYGTGLSPDLLKLVPGNGLTHTYTLNGLDAGTIYWIQVGAVFNSDTLYAPLKPYATRSASSGEIKVFFNHTVDANSLGAKAPSGTSDDEVIAEIIQRIAGAQESIDVALYNNNRTDLTNALKQAYAQGVRVRYVATLDAENNALQPAPAFPVIYGNDQAIMHNKFLVIDADLPDQCWVLTGSMNWTTTSITNDYNNMLCIQDQSLARAYTLEFEEMWGATAAFPNAANSLFGPDKTDNTPHFFNIGGIPTELWFSPSDKTTSQIEVALQSADENVSFSMFSFTNNQLGQALANRQASGAQVQGMIENIDDPGVEIDFLNSQGCHIYPHSLPYNLHHKYGVVDANLVNSDPLVVTGSHNWTFAAETLNDENTLIIHDAGMAQLYQAEFNKRWAEQVQDISDGRVGADLWEIYPNPAHTFLNIKSLEKTGAWLLEIVNLQGQTVVQESEAGSQSILRVDALPAGLYFLKICTKNGIATFPFQKI